LLAVSKAALEARQHQHEGASVQRFDLFTTENGRSKHGDFHARSSNLRVLATRSHGAHSRTQRCWWRSVDAGTPSGSANVRGLYDDGPHGSSAGGSRKHPTPAEPEPCSEGGCAPLPYLTQDRLRRQSRRSKRGNLVALALSIREASTCSHPQSRARSAARSRTGAEASDAPSSSHAQSRSAREQQQMVPALAGPACCAVVLVTIPPRQLPPRGKMGDAR
jgi:hypothetical protein